MIAGQMMTTRQLIVLTAAVALVATVRVVCGVAAQELTPAPKPLKGIAIRGCLMGSRLTHIEPMDSDAPFPDSLGVSGIRVIRSQLKALNGHQVELIGTAEGVGPHAGGLLISSTDTIKLYLGGGDPTLGEDFRRIVPPTFYAHTVRNVAHTCASQPRQ